MKKFIIERTIPGVSKLSHEQLAGIVTASCAVVQDMAEAYNWITSYVAGDKLYCIHEADSEEVIRKHSELGKFPVDQVTEIVTNIGPPPGG